MSEEPPSENNTETSPSQDMASLTIQFLERSGLTAEAFRDMVKHSLRDLHLQKSHPQPPSRDVASRIQALRRLDREVLTDLYLQESPPQPLTGWRKVAAAAAAAASTSQETNEDLFVAFRASLGITEETLNIYSYEKMRAGQIIRWIDTLNEIDDVNGMYRESRLKIWRNNLITSEKYLYTNGDVIEAELVTLATISDSYTNLFQRDDVPDVEEYKNIMMQTTNDQFIDAVIMTNIENSSHDTNKDTIWSCDILGRDLDIAYGNQIAHLIPDSMEDAHEWFDVACWAFALDPLETTWGTALRLLHGVSKNSENCNTRENNNNQASQNQNNAETNGMRKDASSGLRHFQANQIRIRNPQIFLDGDNPTRSVLIVPIMTVDDCKDWDGTGYEAILLFQNEYDLCSLGLNCCLSQLKSVSDATLDEVQKAIKLLRQCTLAMAKSLQVGRDNQRPKVPPQSDVDPKEWELIQEAINARNDRATIFEHACNNADDGTQGMPMIAVPKCIMDDQDLLRYRGVCKVSFSDWNQRVETQSPAPDPLLLVARASVVWSVQNKMRLRAFTGPPDDDYSIDSFALSPLPEDYPISLPLKRKTLLGIKFECKKKHRSNDADDDTLSISSSSVME